MSYIINKTDGSVLTEIVDGTIDQSATDLTLVGKNATTYGEALNENLIKLLENFASTSEPNNPIAGQLWFDTTDNRLKVYDGNGFKVSGGTIFASAAPSNAVQGDLWIDSANQQLYFYLDSSGSKVLAGPVYTKDQGTSGFNVTTVLDTLNKSRTVALVYVGGTLIGLFSNSTFTLKESLPGYSRTSIVIGSQDGNTFTVSNVQSGTITTGMFLVGTNITPGTQILGFSTGTGGVGTYTVNTSNIVAATSVTCEDRAVYAGFNISGVGDLIFNVPVETANNLKATDGSLKTTDSFVSTTDDSAMLGNLTIQNTNPLVLGPGDNTSVVVSEDEFKIVSNATNQNLALRVLTNSGTPGLIVYNKSRFLLDVTSASGNGTTAILSFAEQIVPPFTVGSTIIITGMTPSGYNGTFSVSACTVTTVSYNSTATGSMTNAGVIAATISPRVGLFTETPSTTLDVNGSAVIRGDLVVKGTTTTISTANLEITDKNIELAKVTNPTDLTADQGGITLKGATDKTFVWQNGGGAANTYWNSSENLNLTAGRTYKIGSNDVLSETGLGANIVSSSLTSLGTLTTLRVGNFQASANTITVTNSDGNVILAPIGTGTVNVSNKKITNVATPTNTTDATNKTYVDTYVRSRAMGFVAEISDGAGGQLTDTQIAILVQEVYPAAAFEEGTLCRVHCTRTYISYLDTDGNAIPFTMADSGNPNILYSTVNVDKNTGATHTQSSNQNVIKDIAYHKSISAGNATVKVARFIKVYTVISNSWVVQTSNTSSV